MMRKQLLRWVICIVTFCPVLANAQIIDTLVFQDFEVVPLQPVWNFSGPVIYNSGFSSNTANPPNSPLGIGASRAWETTTNSGGLVLEFDNITIPSGYDTIRVYFNLAAMNLLGSGGGPDNLDYVLVAYSLDGGSTYTNRLRIRGAVNDNSVWPYSATGVASVYYQPTSETMFQPINSGLQTTMGYSHCEIRFDASAISQLRLRITGRSSSSTDTWLIDNVIMTGERDCSESTSSISPVVCDSYTSPGGDVYTASGTYMDTIPNAEGCDSVITINLQVNGSSASAISPVSCGAYFSPAGNIYTSAGTYTDTVANFLGCDSIITIQLTIGTVNTGVTQAGFVLTADASGAAYQWFDCDAQQPVSGETGQVFSPSSDGNYAVIVTENGCSDTSLCLAVFGLGTDDIPGGGFSVYPNPSDGVVNMATTIQGEITVEILNHLGQVLQKYNETAAPAMELYLDEIPGVYFVRIMQPDGRMSVKKLIRK